VDRGVRMIFGVRWTAHTRYGALRKGIKHMLAPSSILFAFGLSGELKSLYFQGFMAALATMAITLPEKLPEAFCKFLAKGKAVPRIGIGMAALGRPG
jgi:hypothetical protein